MENFYPSKSHSGIIGRTPANKTNVARPWAEIVTDKVTFTNTGEYEMTMTLPSDSSGGALTLPKGTTLLRGNPVSVVWNSVASAGGSTLIDTSQLGQMFVLATSQSANYQLPTIVAGEKWGPFFQVLSGSMVVKAATGQSFIGYAGSVLSLGIISGANITIMGLSSTSLGVRIGKGTPTAV
jgi:hypothetical protein